MLKVFNTNYSVFFHDVWDVVSFSPVIDKTGKLFSSVFLMYGHVIRGYDKKNYLPLKTCKAMRRIGKWVRPHRDIMFFVDSFYPKTKISTIGRIGKSISISRSASYFFGNIGRNINSVCYYSNTIKKNIQKIVTNHTLLKKIIPLATLVILQCSYKLIVSHDLSIFQINTLLVIYLALPLIGYYVQTTISKKKMNYIGNIFSQDGKATAFVHFLDATFNFYMRNYLQGIKSSFNVMNSIIGKLRWLQHIGVKKDNRLESLLLSISIAASVFLSFRWFRLFLSNNYGYIFANISAKIVKGDKNTINPFTISTLLALPTTEEKKSLCNNSWSSALKENSGYFNFTSFGACANNQTRISPM